MDLAKEKAESPMVESYSWMLDRGDPQGLGLGQIAGFTIEFLVTKDI